MPKLGSGELQLARNELQVSGLDQETSKEGISAGKEIRVGTEYGHLGYKQRGCEPHPFVAT